MSNCGEYLAVCRCYSTAPRTAAEVAAAHRESVRRAKARGWSEAERLAVVRAMLGDRRVS